MVQSLTEKESSVERPTPYGAWGTPPCLEAGRTALNLSTELARGAL